MLGFILVVMLILADRFMQRRVNAFGAAGAAAAAREREQYAHLDGLLSETTRIRV